MFCGTALGVKEVSCLLLVICSVVVNLQMCVNAYFGNPQIYRDILIISFGKWKTTNCYKKKNIDKFLSILVWIFEKFV